MIPFLLVPFVQAQPSAEEAEIQRLREQLRQSQESGSLDYSERFYIHMINEDSNLEYMTDQDHIMGAMSSNARGDLQSTLQRLERCTESERAIKWRTYIVDNTGWASLKPQPETQLIFLLGMLNPEQIAAIDYANQVLLKGDSFAGRLPNGAYQYGSQNFLVDISGMIVKDVEKSEAVRLLNGPTTSTISMENGLYVGLAGGMIVLGDGIRPETGEVLESTAMPLLGISSRLKFSGEPFYKVFTISAQYGTSDSLQGTSLEPQLGLGYEVGRFSAEVGGLVLGGVMIFPDENYGKMGLGIGGGLGLNYLLQEKWNLNGTTKLGILGSHSVTTYTTSVTYQL